jgi:uncharacterized protein YceH (UPF0502 family)
MTLDPIQLRVLGSLIEKEITTPENYPLSLNSLIGACNQRSSRDPVLDLTEDQVRQALHALEESAIVTPVRDARVPKYEHRLRTVLNLRRDEIAVLCLLMLRGPQTPGELRSRADRLYTFDGIAQVQSTLERLATRGSEPDTDPAATGPLTVMLARQPGARENRFAHLLGDQADAAPFSHPAPAPQPADLDPTLLAELESRIEARLEARIEARLDAKYAARLDQLAASIESLQARINGVEANSPNPDDRPPQSL